MANEVFANGREISCKKADGKTICAFPDVCMTPPTSPATPMGIPIPYPNTGMAKDTTKGSRTVKISGNEIIKKNVSHYKTSYGDEAGCATPAKKGIITGTIKGKVYFKSWSMDVKVEGKNVVRHLDMTTHNHKSEIGNESVPWTHIDRMSMADGIKECDKAKETVEEKCGDTSKKAKCPSAKKVKSNEKSRKNAKDKHGKDSAQYKRFHTLVLKEYANYAEEIEKDECHKALRCFLTPYSPSRCCPKQTPHHVVDAASFLNPMEGVGRDDKRRRKTGWKKYVPKKAPCVCVEGPNQCTATHGEIHARTSVKAEALMDDDEQWSRSQATTAGVESINETFPNTKSCNECLEKQLDKFHDKAKTTPDDRPLDASTEGSPDLKDKFRSPNTAPSR